VRDLIRRGANAASRNDRGWTALHQAGYRNDPEMVSLLLDAGAPVHAEAHGSGGTPLAVALFWGHRDVADVLAAMAVTPDNLRIAAALGRIDLVSACFDGSGALTDVARANRGFYRPHSGFPAWRPRDVRQEILDEALVWAAKSGRIDAMPGLLARGARVDADPYRGTPLAWAAANGRTNAVEWLLDHGASVNQRGTFGGPPHGQGVTALHLAAQNDHADTIRALLERGAHRSITDALYGGTAAGWAEHEGAASALALLRE
jgi:ankyrin repeat protein